MELEKRTISNLELREVGGKPKLEGYAIVFNTDSERMGNFVEQIAPEATRALTGDASYEMIALLDHDLSKPLGRRSKGTLTVKQDDKGVWVSIDPPDTTYGRDAIEAVKRGDKAGMSFAFRASAEKWDKTVTPNRRIVTAISTLPEISIVTVPAYSDTTIDVRKKKESETAVEKEKINNPYKGKQMTFAEIKKLEEQRADLATKAAELRGLARSEDRDLTEDEGKNHDNYVLEAEKLTSVIEREKRAYELGQAMNSRLASIAIHTGKTKEEKGDEEQAIRAFNQYLRKGITGVDAELRNFLSVGNEGVGLNTRALATSTFTGTPSGVVGDRSFDAQVEKVLKSYVGVRQAGASVQTTSNGNPIVFALSDDTANSATIVGEGSSIANNVDNTFVNKTLNAYKYVSPIVRVSYELLEDAAFNVEQHIIDNCIDRHGRAQNTHTTTGTGSGQPEGFLAAKSADVTLAVAGTLVYGKLVDLAHTPDPAVRDPARSVWMMHDSTLAAIRKLADSQSRPLFTAPMEAGQPDRLLGYRVIINNAMPAFGTTAAAKLIAFGDFSTYRIRQTPVTVVRLNELYAATGEVGFNVITRFDGRVGNTAKYAILANP